MQSFDRGNSALAKLMTVAASIEAESRISELHARIDEQRRIIEDLAIEGHDHGSAMIVLDSLQLSLSLYLQERLRLRSKLTDTENAGAASGRRSFIAISRSSQKLRRKAAQNSILSPFHRETTFKLGALHLISVTCRVDVCFTPESRRVQRTSLCPLRANSGHLRTRQSSDRQGQRSP